jgi:hypothetical protein
LKQSFKPTADFLWQRAGARNFLLWLTAGDKGHQARILALFIG